MKHILLLLFNGYNYTSVLYVAKQIVIENSLWSLSKKKMFEFFFAKKKAEKCYFLSCNLCCIAYKMLLVTFFKNINF